MNFLIFIILKWITVKLERFSLNLEPLNESEIGNDAIIEIIMYDNQVSSFSGIESARDQKKKFRLHFWCEHYYTFNEGQFKSIK